jgi:flagellar assembly protein FliH
MADAFSPFRGSGVVLFDEDFDVPPPSPDEPEIIEPTYSATELLAAREEAARASRDATLAEVNASTHTAMGLALRQIASQVAAARAESASLAEQNSEAIAALLLNCFAAAFPALCVRLGPAETAAVVRELLPALHREPKIVIRVNPHLVQALNEEFFARDSELAARVRLIPTDAMAMGDAQITWEYGAAARDTASLWTQIEDILAPMGLLDPAAGLSTPRTAKEHDFGE